MEEGLFPSMQSITSTSAEVEEERRLCYVAITRAKERLIIWDDVPVEDPISKTLYQNVMVKDNFKEIIRYISLDDDDEGWIDEGKRLEDVNDYLSAKHAYMRTKLVDTSKEVQRCNAMLDYYKGLTMVGSEMLISCTQAAENLFDIGEFALAEDIYIKIAQMFGRKVLGINYLRCKTMQNKTISLNDMQNYINSDNFDIEFQDFGCHLKSFFDITIKSNNQIIEKIKGYRC